MDPHETKYGIALFNLEMEVNCSQTDFSDMNYPVNGIENFGLSINAAHNYFLKGNHVTSLGYVVQGPVKDLLVCTAELDISDCMFGGLTLRGLLDKNPIGDAKENIRFKYHSKPEINGVLITDSLPLRLHEFDRADYVLNRSKSIVQFKGQDLF